MPSSETYTTITRADRLIRYCAEHGASHVQLVRAACACARTTLAHVPSGEGRPLAAIVAAEAWASEPTAEHGHAADVAAHAAYAHAAYAAAHAATYAASAAASAAHAADVANAASAATYAAHAAANAANAAYAAANAAAYAAANAAYAAANAANAASAAHSTMCDLVRTIITEESLHMPICTQCDEPLACDVCDRCSYCCACTHCPNCGEVCDDYCSDCERCDSCGCRCRGSAEHDRGSAAFTLHAATAPEHRTMWDMSRMVGCEVEFNRCESWGPLRDWREAWDADIHEDGSCGWECVTSPAAGDHAVRQIRELARAMSNAGAEANERCGVHVHVDARDLQWADIAKLCQVYAHIEPLMYLIGGQQRLGQHYCAPNGETLGAASVVTGKGMRDASLYGAIYGYTAAQGKRMLANIAHDAPHKKNPARYRGLNLCPWVAGMARGAADTTVEFRMHRNCLDGVRILGWAQLCAHVVDWSRKATFRDVSSLPPSNLRAVCDVIAPTLAPWVLSRVHAWRHACAIGARRVRYDYTRGGKATMIVQSAYIRRASEVM